MFVSINAFEEAWKNENVGTQKILDILTDDSLMQEVSPQDRNLGRIAWHIVTSVHEMLSRTGLKFDAAEHDTTMPETARQIAQAYRIASDLSIKAMKSQWTDATLLKKVNMYGELWPNGQTLQILISHEVHHRGQMTVLMRQAGLRVPGVYGPSREEWSQMGMTAPII